MTRLRAEIGIRTDIGRRPDNQDFAGALNGADAPRRGVEVVAAVADGVGGARGGRVAAELAVRGFLDACDSLDPLRGPRRNVSAALQALNAWLHGQGRADPALAGMACTFTAIVLMGRRAHIFHVGDSRLYRLRDDTLTRLTTDHVPDRGAMRNVLTRALGAEPDIRIDYAVEAVREHDRYLLCTDGVHGGLPDRALRAELSRRAGPEETASRLIDSAIASRIDDNATALVIDVTGLPEADQGDLSLVIDALPILPAPPRAGAVIDGYRLDAMLSDGRDARVFRATDEADGRVVIVKIPKPVVAEAPALRQAFLREAWIATRLRSPFLAESLDDATGRRSSLYTVMPFYEGETLDRRLTRRPPVSRAEGLAIIGNLARGVAALHRAGVIHRDIKPENVILTPEGGLRLLDLGVARLPGLADLPGGSAPGTPSYMAPELFEGSEGDERSDLYAVGVTMYRMFTGAWPYGEVEAFSRPRFLRPPTPLLTYRPDLPAWLDQVTLRAVAARPEDRFGDVVELMFALEHGDLQTAPEPPPRRSLLERDPLRFWQIIAALLALALLVSLLRR